MSAPTSLQLTYLSNHDLCPVWGSPVPFLVKVSKEPLAFPVHLGLHMRAPLKLPSKGNSPTIILTEPRGITPSIWDNHPFLWVGNEGGRRRMGSSAWLRAPPWALPVRW